MLSPAGTEGMLWVKTRTVCGVTLLAAHRARDAQCRLLGNVAGWQPPALAHRRKQRRGEEQSEGKLHVLRL